MDSDFGRQWKTPTPGDLVAAFLLEVGWTKTRLIEEMVKKSKRYADPFEAVKKQLRVVLPPRVHQTSSKTNTASCVM